jgi:RNA-directed DNA polymerase
VSSEGDKLPGHGSVVGRHAVEKRPLSSVLTRQQHIATLAKKHAESALSTLSHHMDMLWMQEAFKNLNVKSAIGVDNQSVADYGKNLDENLADLLERVKSGSYQAPAVKRTYVPKDEKEKRPIGIPTTENKVLERAVLMLLEPIYENDFYDCSYGFRKNRSPHQALEKIRDQIKEWNGCWVVDVDVRKYFDSIPHGRLRAILRQRVKDGVILRLIGKWLKAGILEEGQLSYSDMGTPQGGVISPLLSNIYLHEVLDKWFHEQKLMELSGKAKLVRFADDFVLLVEKREDAEHLMECLPKRFEEYGLTIHSGKTHLIDFRHPWVSRKKAGTFDFLGFTHYWGKTPRGGYAINRKTSAKKQTKSLKAIHQWCKANRHKTLKWQRDKLRKKIQGHYAYYGIRGNVDTMSTFFYHTKWIWRYWLNRRSRKHDGMRWARFTKLLAGELRLPSPRVIHYQPNSYQVCMVF